MPTESKSKRSAATAKPSPADRVAVRKTYKLYIGGAFPRSESGRSYPVTGASGELLAHAAQASRKDLRDAVVAARKAFGGWSGATAYNRGQILYRIAEMMEGRHAQFTAEVQAAEGGSQAAAAAQVDAAIDRWVWYAGWTDKYAQVVGGANPVAGPYFNFSLPEPAGVVGVIAPQQESLVGFVSVVAPVIATGNTVVVVASSDRPLPAVSLAEALATSDLPGGVLNLLTGSAAELAPWLAAHRDVNCIDLTGIAPADRVPLAEAAADNVKRVYAPPAFDPAADPGTARLGAFTETKTVWHPMGV
ncbi:MAG TPA: aldehyde dehydrogenase family protein [Jatrophihabitans sp.]|nr:aldehyde dehydrogenase family protein [Jatrophihabitans sp.]